MKFEQNWIGVTQLTREAEVENESNPKISLADSVELQQRRTTRLALLLAKRLDTHISQGEVYADNMMEWESDARELGDTSFGGELLEIIGTAYKLTAIKFLGKLRTGLGLPSVSDAIKSRKASYGLNSKTRDATIGTLKTTLEAAKISSKAGDEAAAQLDDHGRGEIERQAQEKMLPLMVRLHLYATVTDITGTLYTVVEKVLYDVGVDKKRREERAKLLIKVGKVFQVGGVGTVAETEYPSMIQEASMAAQLETILRRDAEEFHAEV